MQTEALLCSLDAGTPSLNGGTLAMQFQAELCKDTTEASTSHSTCKYMRHRWQARELFRPSDFSSRHKAGGFGLRRQGRTGCSACARPSAAKSGRRPREFWPPCFLSRSLSLTPAVFQSLALPGSSRTRPTLWHTRQGEGRERGALGLTDAPRPQRSPRPSSSRRLRLFARGFCSSQCDSL